MNKRPKLKTGRDGFYTDASIFKVLKWIYEQNMRLS